jgi:uncharacterized protein YndB with AHSA1/START domain
MNGKQQIVRNTTIGAPASAVWAVLSDSRLLPEWAPVVDEVTECSVAGEAVGEVRSCNVRLAGKSGHLVERCTEFTPMTRIAYAVDDESFGMRKLFEHYGFAIDLESVGPDKTEVAIETHYTPRTPLYGLLNRLMMRRRFRNVCDELLAGLRAFAESRDRSPASKAGGIPLPPPPGERPAGAAPA